MQEVWKPVVGYEGLYEVSNLGRVKSLSRPTRRKDIVMNPWDDGNGYLCVYLSTNKQRKVIKVHKLVAIMFLNHTPNGYASVVDHINMNPKDNSVSNLRIVSQRDNVRTNRSLSSSIYKGVSFIKSHGKWQATIYMNGKNKNLGLFKNEIDAHYAYQLKLKELC